MDWVALRLSLELALVTLVVLLPLGTALAWWLARTHFAAKALLEALVTLPLVLPPTVLGFYLLVALGPQSLVGRWLEAVAGVQLVFHFSGLVLASLVFNLPFVVLPLQRAFETIDPTLHDAAAVLGMGRLTTFWRVELPLVWRSLVSAAVLTFVHTLGEFGVVLMVGGNIPGQTRTLAIAIYDRVQAFDFAAANAMAALLALLSLVAVAVSFALTARRGRQGR